MKKSKIITKIVALVLALANLFALASCKDTSWAFKSGNDNISAGLYIGYLVDSYFNAMYSVPNQSIDMFEQKIGELETADYIKNGALESVKRYLVIERLFKEYNLSFTKEEQAENDKEFESVWENAATIYSENGCGKANYKKIFEAEKKWQKVFEHYYGPNGKKPLPQKDRKEYFSENYAKIKYISITYSTHFGESVSTSSKATDAQKKEIKELAQKYVDRIKNGEDIDKLIAEEKAFSKDESDAGKNDEATKVEPVEPTFISKDTSENPDAFNKTVFETKVHTPTLAENDTYGYYVFVRYDIDVEKDYEEYDSSVLSAMRGEEFDKLIEADVSKLTLETNDAAISRYDPENITLSFE